MWHLEFPAIALTAAGSRCLDNSVCALLNLMQLSVPLGQGPWPTPNPSKMDLILSPFVVFSFISCAILGCMSV